MNDYDVIVLGTGGAALTAAVRLPTPSLREAFAR